MNKGRLENRKTENKKPLLKVQLCVISQRLHSASGESRGHLSSQTFALMLILYLIDEYMVYPKNMF